jgi:hypothetical protein
MADLRKLLNDGDGALDKNLSDNLNKVFGNNGNCCIKFNFKTSQGGKQKDEDKDRDDRYRIVVTFNPSGGNGEADIGGRVMSIDSGALLGGPTFPHEVGHLLGLRHPNGSQITDADIAKNHVGKDILDHWRKKDHQFTPMQYVMGYDPDNPLTLDDASTNIMRGVDGGSTASCCQINAIKNFVEGNKK